MQVFARAVSQQDQQDQDMGRLSAVSTSADMTMHRPSQDMMYRPSQDMMYRPTPDMMLRPSQDMMLRPSQDMMLRPSQDMTMYRPTPDMMYRPTPDTHRPTPDMHMVNISGIPLCQGGYFCGGKEVPTPEVPAMAMKNFPSTIQKLPLLLRDETSQYHGDLPSTMPGIPHQYGPGR
jgi:hypothetical protein